MRLVVFGASGATGRHVVKLAAKAGWSVRAVVRSEPQRRALTDAEECLLGEPTDPELRDRMLVRLALGGDGLPAGTFDVVLPDA